MLILLELISVSASGQRVFRTSDDSIRYEIIRKQVLDNLHMDIKSDNDELHRKGEKLLIKSIPSYLRNLYSFYPDLIRTNRPDTIKRLGLYLLDGKHLPEKVAACVNLTHLDISGCQIQTLPAWLSDLKHLESLTVTKSGLRRLKLKSVHIRSLNHVDLSYNELRRIPKGLVAFDSLEEMNLTGNRLKTLPKFLNRFPKLALLNLGFNHIRHNRMKSNNNLKSVNLAHNGLKEMSFSLAGFTKLISINLSYNSLTRITKDLGGKNLLAVNLYNNRLDHIPGIILQHSAMMNLDLSHNEITHVPASINKMSGLNVLSLWDNQVAQLPLELTRLPNLSTLYLQDNQLAVLTDSLSRLPLQKLDVGFNRLTTIPDWIFRSTRIEELYVNNNDLTEIREDVLSIANLKVFYLFGNPLPDSPELRRIVKVLRDRGVDIRQ
ncbi:MAG TPA: hypothetical protein VK658_02385 [Chryseolinea sp.]|nr:hypothetical protein [Chryseolinea sp.]